MDVVLWTNAIIFVFSYSKNIDNISVNLWAGLCENSIQHLRSSFTEYSNLYVDYSLFNKENGKCGSVFALSSDGTVKPTVVLFCHGRPSAIPYNVFPTYIKYNREIVILPIVNTPSSKIRNELVNSVHVFRLEKNTGIYVPITKHDLGDPREIPTILFEKLPPMIEKTYIFDETIPLSKNGILPGWYAFYFLLHFKLI